MRPNEKNWRGKHRRNRRDRHVVTSGTFFSHPLGQTWKMCLTSYSGLRLISYQITFLIFSSQISQGERTYSSEPKPNNRRISKMYKSLVIRLPFAVCRSPFAVRRSPFAVRRSPFAVRHFGSWWPLIDHPENVWNFIDNWVTLSSLQSVKRN